MKLTRSLLRPASFLRRRRRASKAGRAYSFFTRKRGAAAADNPEPSSPKVTCIGQVRVKSQKRVKQCRRRINGGEASFRSAEPSFQHQQRRSRRDQRWVHLPSFSVVLRALGHEFCCLFRCCTCSCSCFGFRRGEREREERENVRRSGSGCFADENGRGEMFGRWLVAVNAAEGTGEIEVVGGGGDEEEAEMMMSAEDSRRHVFDDVEVVGDRIEVKGRGFINGLTISIPPKNALLLMRCRSDPIKMAAIANRISSDAGRYEFLEQDEDEVDEIDDGSELKIFVAQGLKQEKEEMLNVGENGFDEEEKPPLICNEETTEEIEQEFDDEEEEEEEEVESNMSSFEALLEQENTENYQDGPIKEDTSQLEESKSDEDKTSTIKDDDKNPTTVVENVKQEKNATALPENQETAAALPDCLLLMMREPKLSMEVSKETWVCATDFIRLLPERPRRAATKAAAAATGGGDQEPAVKRRTAGERTKPRLPPAAGKKNEMQPARSSCSLPAASAAAAAERKRVACEPLALTRCKSEPMSTAAAKLMPEAGCWKENVGMQLEPHRQATLGVSAAGVGC